MIDLALYNSSTGRASNLTSPTSDFSPEAKQEELEAGSGSAPEKIKHSSSSIIGLRAATFDTSNKSKPEVMDSPEEKPRPPPKPRPWSIVGVDRKSGEFTTVETDHLTPASPETITEVESEKTEGRRSSLANRGSVRDMIANLNKPEKEGVGTVGGLLGGQSVRDRIASMNNQSESKKKGNSLPRTAEAVNLNATSTSPGIKPKNSPHNFRKESSSTTDDPRILKLDDDFLYEDTVNV